MFFEIRFGDDSYNVSDDWYQPLLKLVQEAAAASLSKYPDSEIGVPLYLSDCGQRKIACIKEVRALTGMMLKEAKYFCDKVNPRQGVRQPLGTFTWQQARKVARAFTEAGAMVKLPSALELLGAQA